jgi:hypothetical protein
MRQFIFCILFFALFLGELVSAQVPRPFVYGGASLNGGGYKPLSALGGAGVSLDSKHFVWQADAAYKMARKTNDGTSLNLKGHTRELSSSAYYRFADKWFLGAGARWSQLSTTNYSKSAWRPTFGGGSDYLRKPCGDGNCVPDFSLRWAVDYVLPGSDWANGLQGPLLSLYLPSPAVRGHLFWRETVGIYRFHDTVTDRTNPELTKLQMGQRSIATFVEFTLMYRF